MKKTLLFIICFFIFTLFSGVTFSAPASCPTPPPMIDLDAEFERLSALAKSRTEECYNARWANRESTIREYVCPSGDFSEWDRPYTREILAYQIAVATVFQAVDRVALTHAQSLQCLRQKDPIIWQQSNKVFTDLLDGYAAKYRKACDMSYIVKLLDTSWTTDTLIQTSDTFPQYCNTLVNAKVRALSNLWDLIASKAIAKSYQNDKDEFLSKIKGKYAALLEKSSRYFRAMSQAVAKMDTYLKTTIR